MQKIVKMMRTAIVAAAALPLVAAASCDENEGARNTTCLELTFIDMYGDGWDGAKTFIEDPKLGTSEHYPEACVDYVEYSICPKEDGQYFMVNAMDEEVDELPEHYWEVMWTAAYDNCNGTSAYYVGGFNSTMVWDYTADDDKWSLEYWENLWPNEAECDSCGDAKACKPKPKPKGKKHKKKGMKTGGSTSGKTSKNSTQMIDGPRYGPPAVNVQVTMYDDADGDGWFESDYSGANWYISDSTRTELFFSGTLCDGWSGYCKVCLGDGSYVYRVTDNGDGAVNKTTWDFCGIVGDYSEDLTFHIKKGKCHVDSLVSREDTCDESLSFSTQVTLEGAVALTGIPTELLDIGYVQVLTNVLSNEIPGWDLQNMVAIGSTLDARNDVAVDRKLTVFTHDLLFSVTFDVEKVFNVDGRNHRALEILTKQLSEQVEAKMSSGEFLSQLTQNALQNGATLMSTVQGAELVSLKISDVEYTGGKSMVESTLTPMEAQGDGSAYTHISSSYNVQDIAIFCGALAVGFIAFVGVMAKGMNGYEQMSQDSEAHDDTFAVDEVSSAELDQSNAGPKFSSFEHEQVSSSI